MPVDEEWARDFHLDFQPVDLTLAPPHYHARYQPVDHCMSMFVGSETAHIQVKLVCRRMNNEHGIHLVCQCLGVRCRVSLSQGTIPMLLYSSANLKS